MNNFRFIQLVINYNQLKIDMDHRLNHSNTFTEKQ